MRIILFILCVMIFLLAKIANAEVNQSSYIPKRPTILSNRWEEDWSVLANPNVPHERLDSLKYISLSSTNPKNYLSFGANLRNRYEYINAINFGVMPPPSNDAQSYLISRMEVHADLRIAEQLQVFVQLQNDEAPGKTIILPVDKNRLDLEQAFVLLTEPVGRGTFRFRAGRQQMAFDLQRFISLREGPNVRQSFDALWTSYTLDKWKVVSFYSHPLQSRNLRCFDDYSSNAFTFGIFRVERTITDYANVSAYFGHYKQDNAFYTAISGNERRSILDVHLVGGNGASYDWELETMGQIGNVAYKTIHAWALGSISGYTFQNVFWKPRIGFQFDMGSGTHHQNSNTLGTFNPLFPNGVYFTLANFTSYANVIHVKPSLTLTPNPCWTVMFAVAGQWRETTADAIYVLPHNPIPRTVGTPGKYTGTYVQTDVNWLMTPHVQSALQIVYFNIGDALRSVGGHNSTYVGLEARIGW
ncbi:MAG: alginate export family protein [Gammaproteobacteria bacterium]